MAQDNNTQDYKQWSHEALIKRVTHLESQLKAQTVSLREVKEKFQKKPSITRPFEPSKWTTRYIALKLAYLGPRYNGFEHHANNSTPLPTIEEELWKAFAKARLIATEHSEDFASHKTRAAQVDWKGTDYSKCGRTDKGVSAFGQVIGLKVRSNRPLPRRSNGITTTDQAEEENGQAKLPNIRSEDVDSESEPEEPRPFDDIADELDYPRLLNRLLPIDIRILAWCPNPPPDFSARFSCRERRYKYFFTNPAFSPETKGASMREDGEGWLDIEAMRRAAKSFVGLHDFRNFCKIDAGKQITNFMRRIFHAEIEEAKTAPSFVQSHRESFESSMGSSQVNGMTSTGAPRVYTFTLHGSAFLWHQVRHMVAVLFLIGQGLEPESIISDLLDPEKYPRRPTYDLATDAPLVLWDCIFPEDVVVTQTSSSVDSLNWVYACEDRGGVTVTKPRRSSLVDDFWRIWRERKIEETLAAGLLDIVADHRTVASLNHETPTKLSPLDHSTKGKSQRVFDGGDYGRLMGVYLPIHKKSTIETPDFINERYRLRKGIPNPIVGEDGETDPNTTTDSQ